MSAENGQSVQSDVIDAVVAALGGEPARAFRCRFEDFAADECPAINVLPEMEDPESQDNTGTERTLRFMLRHMITAASGADKLADLEYVKAQKLLRTDAPLNEMVKTVREVGKKWEMERGELQVMALVVSYEVEFSTRRDDPSVPGF